MSGYMYLASPYFHHDPFMRERRYFAAMQAAHHFATEGHIIYSPILHWHHVASITNLPRDARFWEAQNKPMLFHAEELWILQIEGWESSQGIKVELKWAEGWGKAVRYK